MKFENSWTGNWKNALHGLRHPYESYDKADSKFGIQPCDWLFDDAIPLAKAYEESDIHHKSYSEAMAYYDKNGILDYDWRNENYEYVFIGPNDMDLAQRMIKAGSPNDKFLRQIFVSVDITGPLYWWKEMDTYKVGTTANSTSTMHKLASTPITIDCFETDDFSSDIEFEYNINQVWSSFNDYCECLRQKYNKTKDIKYWKELIRILPESWLQTRAWSANYAVLRSIIKWRQGHKLSEWSQFIDWCKTLPYAEDLLLFDNLKNL